MSDKARIFIGYDPKFPVQSWVFASSIERRSSIPVMFSFLNLHHLRTYTRGRERGQSNEFTFTRFLPPFLCDYRGWCLYADGDMLCRTDIADLWKQKDDYYAVQLVKHDHRPKPGEKKFLGLEQTTHPRKNWSSLMLMNCERCRALSPEFVNGAAPDALHQFKWLADWEVGMLLPRWNHLVGVNEHDKDAGIVHWTLGGPYFNETSEVAFADEWRHERAQMLHCLQTEQITQEA